jgi:ABC-type Fe3+ transport system permease subunit
MGKKLTKNPFYTILYGSFLLSIIFPIIYTFGKAVFFDVTFTDNLKELNADTFLLLGKSIFIAFLIASFATIIGTFLALILNKTKIKQLFFFKIALLIPLFISPYILAVAWKDFLAVFIDLPIFSNSIFGVVLVLVTVYTPLSMLIIGSALSNIDAQLEESALLISNPFHVITKISIPLIKPALMSSFVLVFIFGISEFSVPAFFGVRVFTTEIFTQFAAFYNHSLAVIQSSLLVLICVLLLYADRKQLTNAPFLSVGNKGIRNYSFELKKTKELALTVLFLWLFVSVIFPLLILIAQALKGGITIFIKAFKLLIPTFSNSILLAVSTALISLIIGFVVAYQSYQTERRIKRHSFDWLLLFVFAIPSSIFGISLISFYNQSALQFIYTSLTIILIAYVGKFTFISSKLIANALKQIPNSFEEVAQIQGVSTFKRIQKIVIPIISPSIFIAFLSVFIFSFGELGISIMLYPPGVELTSIKIFTIMANAPQALTSAMVLILFLVTLLLIMGFYLTAKTFFINKRN